MSNNKKPNVNIEEQKFLHHRKIWNSDNFLKDLIGAKTTKNIRENSLINNFLYQISNIPIQREYLIVGYGSLLNVADIPRTAESAKEHRLGYIEGWERIFNIGYYGAKTSYLNVRESDDILKRMPIALVKISYKDLPNLILRERLYDFIEVNVIDNDNSKASALMVVGDEVNENDSLIPQLNYLHLCITGAKQLGGIKVVNEFLETTYCYSSKQFKQITAKEWLNEVNLIDHMFSIDYSSR